ncbi:hypothetical protein ACFV1L_22150 [Kitasatospora sp. NPDC059646]|uniref:hypothetical protein n=1 Tax=Kitasatospora sp. NPDC059646 TaxID=3346893 RepID=UPI00368E46FE
MDRHTETATTNPDATPSPSTALVRVQTPVHDEAAVLFDGLPASARAAINEIAWARMRRKITSPQDLADLFGLSPRWRFGPQHATLEALEAAAQAAPGTAAAG